MKVLAGVLVAFGMVVALGGVAHADIHFSGPIVTPAGADFMWSYNINLNAAEIVFPLGGVPSFVTLYDIQGLVPGSATYTGAPAGVTTTVTVQNVGITPVLEIPVDSPSIPNITVTYNTGVVGPGSALGTLSFLDTISGGNQAMGNFTAQAQLVTGPESSNLSSVPVPAPEPGSLALLGSGVLGMIGVLRRQIASHDLRQRGGRRR